MGAVDELRKGWCPGALRPMMAKDGLLVRLRITGGIVSADMARALAEGADRLGNGLFDLSGRGNLQMRGIDEATLPALLDRMRTLGLLDANAAAEAVRNVVISPLTGCHADIDVGPIGASLERRLAADTAMHALPPKFSFLIDDGSAPSLASLSADVRFDWRPAHAHFEIGLGGTAGNSVTIGTCDPSMLAESAVRVATGALNLGVGCADRRMRRLIAACGAEVVAFACGGTVQKKSDTTLTEPRVVGWHTFAGARTLGLGIPFGRLDSAMLRHAADVAAKTVHRELRLTPWRAILVPDAVVHDCEGSRRVGFIVADNDARRAVAACVGESGCGNGTTSTHADAEALADLAAALSTGGIALHVSGCEKGCAKPSASAVTLVGRHGRYDLVRDGRAGEAPVARGLDRAAARTALRAMVEPA